MAKSLKEFLESYDFNRAALAKQRLQNLRHAGGRVRGARVANLMRAAGLREEEMEEADLDQLDEVLSKDDKAGDWIHDFVHSTNPKFEGKSKKERIKMALGAYYGKQNEDVNEALVGGQKNLDKNHNGELDKQDFKILRGKKKVSEEVEQIDELSKSTLGSYVKGAARDVGASRKLAADFKNQADKSRKPAAKAASTRLSDKFYDIAQKRHKGIGKAVERLTKEEAEHVEEGLADAMLAHAKKISPTARIVTADQKKKETEDLMKKRAEDRKNAPPAKPYVHHDKYPLGGYDPLSHRSYSEETEQIDELSRDTLLSYANKVSLDSQKHSKDPTKRSGEKASRSVTGYARAHNRLEKPVKEDVEQIDEKSEQARRNKMMKNSMDASRGAQFNRTSGLNIKPGDTGHQTAQQMNKALGRNLRREELELDEQNDTPPFDAPYKTVKGDGNVKDKSGAVHTPMSRARDLARKAIQKQREQKVNEAAYAGLEKEDKPGKIKTAVIKTHPKAVESETVEGWKDAKKPVKEEYDDITYEKKTFSEMLSTLLEYTPGEGGVTRIQGRGYGNAKGAKYGNTDYDSESLEKKDDEGEENKPAKRGPKVGSKRGPRTNLGSSKLHNK